MSNHVTNRLAESLREQAGRVAPGPSMEEAARRQAGQIRRRRRITAAASCLAVLAIAAPFGLSRMDSPSKTDIAPINTQSPEPAPTPASGRVDLADLPLGDAPSVPYYSASDVSIHDGNQATPLGHLQYELTHESTRLEKIADASIIAFAPTPNGYVVEAACCDGLGNRITRGWLIDTEGEVLRDLGPRIPVLSTDGRTLAGVGYEDERFERGYLYTLDTTTGEELSRSDVIGKGLFPTHFVDGRVAFASTPTGPKPRVWDPRRNTISNPDEPVDEPRSDGPLLLPIGGRHHDFGLLADSTSEPVRLPIADLVPVGEPVEEGAERLVFVASAGGRQVLVRCTMDGECERASELRRPGGPGNTAFSLQSRGRVN